MVVQLIVGRIWPHLSYKNKVLEYLFGVFHDCDDPLENMQMGATKGFRVQGCPYFLVPLYPPTFIHCL